MKAEDYILRFSASVPDNALGVKIQPIYLEVNQGVFTNTWGNLNQFEFRFEHAGISSETLLSFSSGTAGVSYTYSYALLQECLPAPTSPILLPKRHSIQESDIWRSVKKLRSYSC